jgi:hypothetical protein
MRKSNSLLLWVFDQKFVRNIHNCRDQTNCLLQNCRLKTSWLLSRPIYRQILIIVLINHLMNFWKTNWLSFKWKQKFWNPNVFMHFMRFKFKHNIIQVFFQNSHHLIKNIDSNKLKLKNWVQLRIKGFNMNFVHN